MESRGASVPRYAGSTTQPFESRLRAKLDVGEVRRNLGRAGLVLTIYEFIKLQIIDAVRDFFIVLNTGADRYETDVVARAPKSKFEASCLWLLEAKALESADYETLKALRKHRNAVAHELAAYVADPDAQVNMELVRDAAGVLRRLGHFWGRIEVDSNPDFDSQHVADEDIRSGPSIFVDFLLDIVDSEPRPF